MIENSPSGLYNIEELRTVLTTFKKNYYKILHGRCETAADSIYKIITDKHKNLKTISVQQITVNYKNHLPDNMVILYPVKYMKDTNKNISIRVLHRFRTEPLDKVISLYGGSDVYGVFATGYKPIDYYSQYYKKDYYRVDIEPNR
jgi:hypothetical protein